VRIFLARHSFTVAQFLLWLISLILVACSYFFLQDAAKPTFERGVLVDGGYDISSKGWMEYCHDIIYICCFTVVCAIFSNKFWFTLLLVCFHLARGITSLNILIDTNLCFVFYHLFVNITVQSYWFQGCI
jgi:hypothetical protein